MCRAMTKVKLVKRSDLVLLFLLALQEPVYSFDFFANNIWHFTA